MKNKRQLDENNAESQQEKTLADNLIELSGPNKRTNQRLTSEASSEATNSQSNEEVECPEERNDEREMITQAVANLSPKVVLTRVKDKSPNVSSEKSCEKTQGQNDKPDLEKSGPNEAGENDDSAEQATIIEQPEQASKELEDKASDSPSNNEEDDRIETIDAGQEVLLPNEDSEGPSRQRSSKSAKKDMLEHHEKESEATGKRASKKKVEAKTKEQSKETDEKQENHQSNEDETKKVTGKTSKKKPDNPKEQPKSLNHDVPSRHRSSKRKIETANDKPSKSAKKDIPEEPETEAARLEDETNEAKKGKASQSESEETDEDTLTEEPPPPGKLSKRTKKTTLAIQEDKTKKGT